MMPLRGQRILLIGIGFYDYEVAIAAEFRALGADVLVENEQPPEMRGRLAPLRRRFFPDMVGPLRRHHAAILERVRAMGALDQILVIKGTLLEESFLKALREAQPQAVLTAYHWDSMARYPDLIHRQRLFDRVLTFDHADAAAHASFILRPLFFRPELLAAPPAEKPIDLCFVGWLHHDRLRQAEKLHDQANAMGLSTFFYFFTGAWTGARLRFAGRARDVHVRPLTFARYVEKVAAARVIVDLPHPLQTGLTMRAIETVGVGKKLMTTSRDIASYDFYRSENIRILDPAEPQIDPDFVESPPAAIQADIVERYSLRAWALDVLGYRQTTGFTQFAPDGDPA